jgi:predicted amidohydrolase YtcJ
LGFPVSVHAIGDEAVSVVLSLLQDPRLPKLAVPDRIEHLQLLSEEVLESLNVPNWVASMQPLHLLDDREVSERLLGERSRSYYRLASLARKGVILNFGSDAPVADVSPWLGMQAATRRRRRDEVAWYEEECLSPELALGAYTHEATRALGWTQTGRLEAGCWADFCVVDRSPLTCERPSQVRVLRTVVGGQTHYVV